MNDSLLAVKGLTKFFPIVRGLSRRVLGTVRAVDGVTFTVERGETVALVGESGCGKTTTGRCILRAVEPTSGEIVFRPDGVPLDVVALNKTDLKAARRDMSLVFQDPYSSLNPRMTVLEIVGEHLVNYGVSTGRRDLEERVAVVLREVGLDPELMRRYPHAFSGGQRQRIAIARALSLHPKFVVADEPVSALDVSVQAQILNLLEELQERFQLTYLFVAHNLAVVKYISDRVLVMYVGKIVEAANTDELFESPRHPYTEALLSAVPSTEKLARRKRIVPEGEVADPANPPSGCYFHPRCRYRRDVCEREAPALREAGSGAGSHLSACHFADTLDLAGI